MIEEFRLPDVGEGVAEGELVEWHVEPGDEVVEDQVVAEVETDKALVEVPSPYNGTVAELLAEEGEIVPVGDVIITFEVPGEDEQAGETAEPEPAAEPRPESEAEPEPEPEPASETETDAAADAEEHAPDARVFAPPSVRRLARELGVDLATVDGSGPGGRITEGDVRATAEGAAEASEDEESAPAAVSFGGRSATSGGDAGDGQAVETGDATPAGRSRTLAAPATRKLAEEEGLDIDDVPTDEEREGEAFVTPDHVRAYADAQRAAQEADAAAVSAAGEGAAATETGAGETEASDAEAAASADAAAAPEAAPGASSGDEDERVPYRGVRRAIGEQMQRSKYTAPHVSHHDTAVVDDLVALRAELKPHAEERGVSLTYMPFVMAAVVKALKEFPVLNAMLDEEAEEIVYRKEYHLGVAVATEAGLMVPVVRDVDRKGGVELASELGGLVERARERKITREEMQGSTFTLTNFGAIGGEYATPIINYPEVAILGLGAIEQRPVVENGEVVARHTLPLSLSIDHRVVDGADAGRFTNRVIELLENPRLLLL
ncbi:branched-chain alpha-keto acid dehydrogenase subunit E2 [Salinigranum rubrum]|uniref:Branched-chain alpha-keto acid dehydrogenase subunit E2 n=1 Tax=Salinigranum rubrum TaxID=755307 RepID=A0A2I8VP80_9EURY|nr:dihydrolipoamide acetyltransferase family protein [Salinigranum rubrum]AUV83716.1 branched-chain alpha-keto acid dehydrogenase subunit E2 [Salinigranum rubrum]